MPGREPSEPSQVDVLYVVALPEELDPARAVATGADHGRTGFLGHPGVDRWYSQDDDDPTPYELGTFELSDGSSFTVAIASLLRMGPDGASRCLATLVERLHPRCLAMSGVCAGHPDKTAYGDVIIAETAYFAKDGKNTPEGFRHDIRTHPMPPQWQRAARKLTSEDLPSFAAASAEDATIWFLTALLEGHDPRDQPERRAFFPHREWADVVNDLINRGLIQRDTHHGVELTVAGRSIAEEYQYDHPDGPATLPFAVTFGPMTSLPFVEANNPWEVLATGGVRTVIGVEMEAGSVAASAHELDVQHWIVAKGVMDHALSKNDRYKPFAARASAEVVWKFLIERGPHRLPLPSRSTWVPDRTADDLASTTEAASLPPTNLRLPADPFIDRDAPRERCLDLLLNGQRLVTLWGPTGVGKSRLALELANEIRGHYDDRVYVIDLSVISDPDLVFATITQVLQIDVGDPLIDALREVFRGHPTLLILENFERVAGAAVRVEDLLNAAREVQIVVTSNKPLDVRSEAWVEVEPLANEHAEELFLTRSQGVIRQDSLTSVADLCEALNGHPLAIEVVAARARSSTLSELRELLGSSHFLQLENQIQGVPERHKTLDLAIGWSFNLLETKDRTTFLRLSVLEGPWTEQAARAVTHDLTSTLPLSLWLQPLLDRRFVVPDDHLGDGHRYTMYFAMRDFGRAHLAERPELEAATKSEHAGYFLELVERHGAQLLGPEGFAAAELLSRDHSDINAALNYFIVAGDTSSALRMAISLDNYWWSRSYAEGYNQLNRVLQLELPPTASLNDRINRAKASLAAGKLAIRQCDLSRSATFFQEAITAGHALGQTDLEASALERGALVDVELCRYEEARSKLETALQIFEGVADRAGIEGRADCLDGLGIIACELGQHTLAQEHFRASLELYDQVSGPQLSAWVRNDLAQFEYLRGDLLEARLHAEYVQTVGHTHEELGLLTWSGNTLGHVSAAENDLETARNYFGESLTLAMLQGNLRPRLRALEGLAVVAAQTGNHAQAATLLAAIDHIRIQRSLPRATSEATMLKATVIDCRDRLTDLEGERARVEGEVMTLDQATEFAREI